MSRPDVLDGLTLRQRLRREIEDTKFLATHKEVEMVSNPQGVAKDSTKYLGLGLVASELGIKPWDGREIEIGIGSRLDLNHPLHFDDNILTDCTDCGCRLQHRPYAPQAKAWLCICCVARRVREMK